MEHVTSRTQQSPQRPELRVGPKVHTVYKEHWGKTGETERPQGNVVLWYFSEASPLPTLSEKCSSCLMTQGVSSPAVKMSHISMWWVFPTLSHWSSSVVWGSLCLRLFVFITVLPPDGMKESMISLYTSHPSALSLSDFVATFIKFFFVAFCNPLAYHVQLNGSSLDFISC